jgi:glycosyltransferase involved in cell wall biosynthesis
MAQSTDTYRRLLMVTYHFPPSGAVATFRMLGFARHLPHYGWRVGVVAPPRVPSEPVDNALLARVPANTPVFPAPYTNGPLNKLARLVMHDGVWMPRALPAVLRAYREFRPDAVLTSGPPHCVHLFGLLLKVYYGLPWVACFRDPCFTNCPPYAGWSPWGSWSRFLEKHIVQHADTIIANTPLACEGFKAAYSRHRAKMTFVTNGFDPELFPPPRPLAPQNPRLTILHAGELYNGRDPRPFLDALHALESRRPADSLPIRCRLLGMSTDHNLDLVGEIEKRGLGHIVELGGQVPYTEALAAMTQADLLLLLDTPGRKVFIPAKLYEYLGAARPVLALAEPDGDVAWVLRTSGTPHRVARALDAAAIEKALVELRADLGAGRLQPPSGDQMAAFDRAKLAGDFARQLDQLPLRGSKKKGTDPVVRSTLRAAGATGSVPFFLEPPLQAV